jgi:RHS repeat-associated protein
MITSITRLAGAAAPATVGFTYDKTYQLTAEFGCYASNFTPFMSFVVSNQFAYDPAGNRILSVGAATAPQYYSHTSDNQLTGIYWNTSKLTLGGILQDCLTAHWVKVKQSTAATWVPAQLKLRKAHDVAWLATNVPVSGTGTLTFDIQAQITNNFVITQTVQYKRSAMVAAPGNITYTYDANGNRTEKWTNSLFAARYFYDTDNQLLGISFNNDLDYTDAGDYAYSYDPFGRRISATEEGVTRYFVHDGLDCIAELNSTPSVTKWYVRGSGLGGGIGDIIAEVRPTTTNYYCYNHRGDVVGLVSKAGVLAARYEYTAFGKPLVQTTNACPLAFSSKEYDSKSGLSYYGFRYYDADSGRWMTKDPLLWSDNLNLYGFVGGNPLEYIDFYGLIRLADRIGGAEGECAYQYRAAFMNIKSQQAMELANSLNPVAPKQIAKNAFKFAKAQAKYLLKNAAKQGIKNATRALDIIDAAQTIAEISSIYAKYLTPLELVWLQYCKCLEDARRDFPKECITPCQINEQQK